MKAEERMRRKKKLREEIEALLPQALEIAKARQVGRVKSPRVWRVEWLMKTSNLNDASAHELTGVLCEMQALVLGGTYYFSESAEWVYVPETEAS